MGGLDSPERLGLVAKSSSKDEKLPMIFKAPV
jgi:hypothetical protein